MWVKKNFFIRKYYFPQLIKKKKKERKKKNELSTVLNSQETNFQTRRYSKKSALKFSRKEFARNLQVIKIRSVIDEESIHSSIYNSRPLLKILWIIKEENSSLLRRRDFIFDKNLDPRRILAWDHVGSKMDQRRSRDSWTFNQSQLRVPRSRRGEAISKRHEDGSRRGCDYRKHEGRRKEQEKKVCGLLCYSIT